MKVFGQHNMAFNERGFMHKNKKPPRCVCVRLDSQVRRWTNCGNMEFSTNFTLFRLPGREKIVTSESPPLGLSCLTRYRISAARLYHSILMMQRQGTMITTAFFVVTQEKNVSFFFAPEES